MLGQPAREGRSFQKSKTRFARTTERHLLPLLQSIQIRVRDLFYQAAVAQLSSDGQAQSGTCHGRDTSGGWRTESSKASKDIPRGLWFQKQGKSATVELQRNHSQARRQQLQTGAASGLTSSSSISHHPHECRSRHLMMDLAQLLPHCKRDSKLDTKTDRGVINEVADMKVIDPQ